MNWEKQLNHNNRYENVNYVTERKNKKKLVIDVTMNKDTLNCNQLEELHNTDMLTKFTVKLSEPLIIDKLSDIYLEQFITFNGMDNTSDVTGESMAYILKIKEFNNDTNYGTNIFSKDLNDGSCRNPCAKYDTNKYGSIIIPNSSHHNSNNCVKHCNSDEFITHINPTRITELNGTITNSGKILYDDISQKCDGKPINYGNAFKDKGRFIATFIFKS